ncbi:MAG: hydroxyisourate hydrolase, partial [Streptosporangiaceae bacterium]
VTTHVIDTMRGEPASGVVDRLEPAGYGKNELGRGTNKSDGRIYHLVVPSLSEGTYRLVFETGAYLEALDAPGRQHAFFPEVVVTFAADGLRPRYHVPLLLSPYSYSTYRGS